MVAHVGRWHRRVMGPGHVTTWGPTGAWRTIARLRLGLGLPSIRRPLLPTVERRRRSLLVRGLLWRWLLLVRGSLIRGTAKSWWGWLLWGWLLLRVANTAAAAATTTTVRVGLLLVWRRLLGISATGLMSLWVMILRRKLATGLVGRLLVQLLRMEGSLLEGRLVVVLGVPGNLLGRKVDLLHNLHQ